MLQTIKLNGISSSCWCWYYTVPGPPSSVYFPEVTEMSARIAWSEPREPNGVITGYRVSYDLRSSLVSTTSDDSLSAVRRDYRVTGLTSYRYYVFTVAAKTRSGWGAEESLLVYTVSDRSELVRCLPPYLHINSSLFCFLSLYIMLVLRGHTHSHRVWLPKTFLEASLSTCWSDIVWSNRTGFHFMIFSRFYLIYLFYVIIILYMSFRVFWHCRLADNNDICSIKTRAADHKDFLSKQVKK